MKSLNLKRPSAFWILITTIRFIDKCSIPFSPNIYLGNFDVVNVHYKRVQDETLFVFRMEMPVIQ